MTVTIAHVRDFLDTCQLFEVNYLIRCNALCTVQRKLSILKIGGDYRNKQNKCKALVLVFSLESRKCTLCFEDGGPSIIMTDRTQTSPATKDNNNTNDEQFI